MGYAIAAGHERTARAAEDVLLAGGNAFDASVAAFLVAVVAEPCMASLGGGIIALLHSADAGKLHVIDAFTQTPGHKLPEAEIEFIPLEVDFGDEREVFYYGAGSVAVPGVVAGLFAINERFGRMPMKELIQPAVQASREGVKVTSFVYHDMGLLSGILGFSERGKELFFRNGKLRDTSDSVFLPHFADFLEHLASEGKAAFYQGEVAQSILDLQRDRGHLTMVDLKNYHVEWRSPLVHDYQAFVLATAPYPSIGGRMIRGVLEKVGIDLGTGISVADSFAVHIDEILSDPNRHSDHIKKGGTSHFSIVDGWGNAVSLSMTLGEGSGHFIPNTDIQLNNMLGEAALMPNGFHSWIPDRRMVSMMSPTITYGQDDSIDLVLGTGGASRIPFAIAQVIAHYYLDKRGLEEAIEHPRIHVDDHFIQVEGGEPQVRVTIPSKKEVKYWSRQNMYFGGVHTISRTKKGFNACGDRRRTGFGISKNEK
jgi:gamma-glutamyltranspeptidase/glutathione hydrolase